MHKGSNYKKNTKVVDLNTFLLYGEALRIVYRNILIKSLCRTKYNKEFIHLIRYRRNGRIANNCQNIFYCESI